MASIASALGVVLPSSRSMEALRGMRGGCISIGTNSISYSIPSPKPRRAVVVRAEAINPEIRKSEPKVVDSVVVTELAKPLTAYCRCWRSGTFPLCDGSHVKHNKETGDNVGPLLLKKQ